MWASIALAVFCRMIFVGAHHSGLVQAAVGLVLPLLLRALSRMGVGLQAGLIGLIGMQLLRYPIRNN